MMNSSFIQPDAALQPVICIDLKKNRIRIHKVTLHILGDPDYILLLINPTTGTLAIKETVSRDYLALRIRKDMLTDGNCYEIYSTELFRALKTIRSDWENDKSYRIYGVCDKRFNVAYFAMKDTILVEDMLSNE